MDAPICCLAPMRFMWPFLASGDNGKPTTFDVFRCYRCQGEQLRERPRDAPQPGRTELEVALLHLLISGETMEITDPLGDIRYVYVIEKGDGPKECPARNRQRSPYRKKVKVKPRVRK